MQRDEVDKSRYVDYRLCGVADCRKPHSALGLCQKHYKAQWARQYRAANREKDRAYKRGLYRRNHLAELERARLWRTANLKKHRESVQAWKERHPEETKLARKVAKHKRRAREGKFTISDVRALFAVQCGRCAICRDSIALGYEVDHIVSIARGGSNWPMNLQLLCRRCNRRKGAK